VLDTVARFLLHLASLKKALSKSLPSVRQVKSITVAVAVAQTLLHDQRKMQTSSDIVKKAVNINVTIMLPCSRRPVVRPHRRAAAVRSAPAVCYKRIAVDRAGTRYTMCCCFRTAPTAFTWTSRGRRGKVCHRYGILLLLATDAARRPGLNVVLCGDRLFQQYVVDACAKMEQQRLNYLRLNQNSFCT